MDLMTYQISKLRCARFHQLQRFPPCVTILRSHMVERHWLFGRRCQLWNILLNTAPRHPCGRSIPLRAPRPAVYAPKCIAGLHLRNLCPMNIGPDLSSVGKILWRDNSGLRQDVGRLETAWTEQLNRTDGPFLFGEFGAVDAYFSPVVMR